MLQQLMGAFKIQEFCQVIDCPITWSWTVGTFTPQALAQVPHRGPSRLRATVFSFMPHAADSEAVPRRRGTKSSRKTSRNHRPCRPARGFSEPPLPTPLSQMRAGLQPAHYAAESQHSSGFKETKSYCSLPPSEAQPAWVRVYLRAQKPEGEGSSRHLESCRGPALLRPRWSGWRARSVAHGQPQGLGPSRVQFKLGACPRGLLLPGPGAAPAHPHRLQVSRGGPLHELRALACKQRVVSLSPAYLMSSCFLGNEDYY